MLGRLKKQEADKIHPVRRELRPIARKQFAAALSRNPALPDTQKQTGACQARALLSNAFPRVSFLICVGLQGCFLGWTEYGKD